MKKENKILQPYVILEGNLINRRKSLFDILRILVWLFSAPKVPTKLFISRINSLWAQNGISFTALYLKECVRIFQHYLSGNPVSVSIDTPVGIVGGLPSIIPGVFRSLIRDGNTEIIRLTYTILSLYRILSIPGKLKLNTITDPFKGQVRSFPSLLISNGLKSLLTLEGVQRKWSLPSISPISPLHISGAAGPSSSKSFFDIFNNIAAFEANKELKSHLFTFGSNIPGGIELLNKLFTYASWYRNLFNYDSSKYLGRLHIKEEAAGKLRVFAITDVITQTILKPLHTAIFKLLKTIPTDGTFDQIKPIIRLINLKKEGIISDKFYSFDLSAATDRLPIDIQRDIIMIMYQNIDMAQSWAKLLIERDWVLPLNKNTQRYITEDLKLKYEVGQPMGALSSWAMLALTHHTIVHIAAIKAGIYQFSHYAILGDDVVIANKAVADQYLLIMQMLGVDINMSKTLIGESSLEFAKRLIVNYQDMSAISAKNFVLSMKTITGIPSLLRDCYNKAFTLEESHINDLFKGRIPFVRNLNKTERLLWVIKGPFGFVPSADGLTSSMKLVNSLSAVRMNSLLDSIDQGLFQSRLNEWSKSIQSSVVTLHRLALWVPDEIRLLSYPIENLQKPLHKGKVSFRYFTPLGVNPVMEWFLSGRDPVIAMLRKQYHDHFIDLIKTKPVRRYIFDGPIVFFNFYREGWMKEMMDYIVSKIHTNPRDLTSLMDPFEDVRDPVPFISSKGEDFFSFVKAYEKEKDSLRNLEYWG